MGRTVHVPELCMYNKLGRVRRRAHAAVQGGQTALVPVARARFVRGSRKTECVHQIGRAREEVGRRRPVGTPEPGPQSGAQEHGCGAGGRGVDRTIRRRQSR